MSGGPVSPSPLGRRKAAWIDERAAVDRSLSHSARLVLLALSTVPGKLEDHAIAAGEIASYIGVSRRTVEKALASLQKTGWLAVASGKASGSRSRFRLVIPPEGGARP